MATPISNSDDVIDSRDVIERIAELKDELEIEGRAAEHMQDAVAELASLEKLAEEASGYAPDWEHGETLIRDSYFERYAEELAEDIGDYDSRNVRWPYTCINWERAARQLQMDYTAVDFDGVTYWIR